MAGELKRGDKVLVEGTVIDVQKSGREVWLNVHGTAPVKVKRSDIGEPMPGPEPRRVNVKATIDISGYPVGQLLDCLESWEETIRGLGYVTERSIADDDKSVTFWCAFETDEGDGMHARDRAQEVMQELEASSTSLEWEYLKTETAVP